MRSSIECPYEFLAGLPDGVCLQFEVAAFHSPLGLNAQSGLLYGLFRVVARVCRQFGHLPWKGDQFLFFIANFDFHTNGNGAGIVFDELGHIRATRQ